jgi:LacI family transcriptional regulator
MRKTLRDVAKEAGVSLSVAARAMGNYGYISKKAKDRVLKAAKRMVYQPNVIARSLKTNQTRTIGVIITDITNSFCTTVARAIEDATLENEYSVILCNSDEDSTKEERYLKILFEKKVDGLIIEVSSDSNRYLKRLIKNGLPVILLDRRVDDIQTTQVVLDNEGAACEAVNHLMGLGHQRIGIINGPPGVRTSEERFEGYKKALQERGIEMVPELVKYGNFEMEEAKKCTYEFLSTESPPTALFVTNNAMTTGALLALHENRVKIPDQMAIVGFDDPEWAPLVKPPLTAVRQPTYSIGILACQALLQKIKKRKIRHEEIVVKPKLIIRESCGARSQRGQN